MIGKQKYNKLIEDSFGQNPLEGFMKYNAQSRLDKVRRYHDALDATNSDAWTVDEITWNDLEMDQVFLRVNHTNSFIGEQVLYHKLHILDKGKDEIQAREFEKKLSYLADNKQKRVELEEKLSQLNKRDEAYYLAEFLLGSSDYNIGHTFIYHILQFLLVALFVVGIITSHWIAFVGVLFVVFVNLMIFISQKRKYEAFFLAFCELKEVYACAKWVEKHDKQNVFMTEETRKSLRNLNRMSRLIYGMNSRRSASLTGDVALMLQEYLWGILLIDVSMFNYILKAIENKQDDVLKLLDFVGEIDADIAVLSFRNSVNQWCTPAFDGDGIKVTALAHPLLKNPVTNDFVLQRQAMITGANASGKSTFMKAVALNALLAQSIHTAIAESFSMKPVLIMTCMALRDDILTGESYYFREAKYLKRILDLVVSEKDVLIVIDEILKGTNTKERISASKAILEYVGDTECLALVATHDYELTENKQYQYYYFDSVIEEGDVRFDYVLREGKNASSNAIALLDSLGYPKEVVDHAKMYLKEGESCG